MDCIVHQVTKRWTGLSNFHFHFGASLIAQLVKNLPAVQETLVFDSWVGKICWLRDRLPTPVFLAFPVARLLRTCLHCRRSGFSLAAPGISCGTQDLQSLLQRVGPLLAAYEVLVAASSLTRDQTQTHCIESMES